MAAANPTPVEPGEVTTKIVGTCEGCGELATREDVEGIPLCQACYDVAPIAADAPNELTVAGLRYSIGRNGAWQVWDEQRQIWTYPCGIGAILTALASAQEEIARVTEERETYRRAWNRSDAEKASLTREHDQAVQERDRLRRIGAQFANVAFNLAQRPHLDDRERAILDQLRREWDEAVRSPAYSSPE